MTPRTYSRAPDTGRGVVAWDMPPRYQPRPDGAAWAVTDTRTGRVLARYPTEHDARCMAREIARAVRRAIDARRASAIAAICAEFSDHD